MASDTCWDVNKYKVPYESEEHWLLKKQFMEAHKDKFPEDRLICLAQCFFNIEFMGTRYPEKVMKLVEELSADVAAEHREKQKTKLQRTFVKASDAAEAKVKASKRSSNFDRPDNKKRKEDGQNFTSSENNERITYESEVIVPRTNSAFSDLVLFEYGANTNPKGVIKTSLDKVKRTLDIDFKFENNKWKCILKIGPLQLSEGVNEFKKEAETCAFLLAHKKLLNDCYTIQVTTKNVESLIKDNERIQKAEIVSDSSKDADEKLSQDNVGMKLMKMMGWAGGGLGKNEQGREEPVTVSNRISRSGLGTSDSKSLMKKLKDLLNDFRQGEENIIAFSSDFQTDERAFIHQFARRNGFASKSYGKNENRYITISKASQTSKVDPWSMVKTLYALEGKESTLDSARNSFKLILPQALTS